MNHSLFCVLQARDEFARARPLFARALAIFEKALGPQHPNTSRVRGNLSRLLLDIQNPAEVAPLAERALTDHEAALGAAHAWTIDAARVTADAWDALGRSGEVAALCGRYGL